ncbi:type II toxin-antitoxin system RelE/ParE family toxin [Geofilum rubicundum]|uniref:type II toxin-antitoxin system RelE/ParE family toxin n=1 Tax=Geofilum rubicundum TaxID=472113 RepID=UPI00078635F9|nr:type II toxin-antitoxin system RelE/ParE family toxin [Geofilum rubicundum]
MREIDITEKCLEFIDLQGPRVSDKFFQLIEIIGEVRIVHANFVKKITNSRFYELRIKAGNEYRVLIFAIDHLNFSECVKAVCLNGFIKRSNKDYVKAIKDAEKILEDYLKNQEL